MGKNDDWEVDIRKSIQKYSATVEEMAREKYLDKPMRLKSNGRKHVESTERASLH